MTTRFPLGTAAPAGAAATRATPATTATRRPCTGAPSHARATPGNPGGRVRARAPRQGHRLDARARSRRLGAGRPRARQLRHALRARLGPRPHARDAARLRRLARPHAAPARDAGRRGPLRPRRAGRHRRRPSSSPSSSSARWAGSPTAWARSGSTAPPARWRRRSSSRAARCSTSARAPTSTSPTSRSSSAPCSSRPGSRARGRARPRAARRSPASSGPRRGCSRAPTSSGCGSAACATRGCGRWPPPRRCCGRSATSSSPATRCTRSPARATPRSACSAITGLDEVPGTVPRRLGEILREPVLFGAAGGGLLALAFLRPRVALGAAAGVVAIVAFCVLAAAGLPILGRYLLAPADDPRDLLRRGRLRLGRAPARAPVAARWAWFGALTLVGLVVFIPPQVDRIGNLRDALRIQDAHPGRPARAARRASPLHAGHRAQPPPGAAAGAVARRRPAARSPSPRSSGRAAAPTSCRRARASRASTSSTRATSTRASRRRRAGFRPVGANASWRAFARCGRSGPCTLLRSRSTSACASSGSGTGFSRCARRDPLKAASFRT